MPLSWLPLISDYTREAAKPVRATAVSVITYSIVSIFMYTIGMGAALFDGRKRYCQYRNTNYVKEHGELQKAIEVYCGLTENEWELKQLIWHNIRKQ